MRHIQQPGPPSPHRIQAVPAAAIPIDAQLPAGPRLLDALQALLAPGYDSACLTLSGGSLHPFAYVIPALSPDPHHAAFYSAPRRPAAAAALHAAAVTLGTRDEAPFFHCHGLWTNPDGHLGCGHILPDETTIASPIRAQGFATTGARFEVHPDPETGFNLFTPIPTNSPHPTGARPCTALRLAPNQDLTTALEHAARAAGYPRAIIAGGVASIIGARFQDAPDLQGFATELLVRQAEVDGTRHAAPSHIEIAIVDLHDTIRQGRLTPGDNPVLMTFEGLLVPL